MPLSAVDNFLIMEPMNGCCFSWADAIMTMDLKQSSWRAFPSETALLVLEALLEGKRMSEIRSIIATSQHPTSHIGANTAKYLAHMHIPASVVRYLRILEQKRSKGLTEE